MRKTQKEIRSQFEADCYRVLTLLGCDKADAIKPSQIKDLLGFQLRYIKDIIKELRKEYPIISRKQSPGGYWIAASDVELEEYLIQLTSERDGYTKTIQRLSEYRGSFK